MSGRQDRDDLRAEILAQVRRYADQACAPLPFEPGVSRVPYAGRVFDAEEMVQLVDSALPPDHQVLTDLHRLIGA